ncbi:MAG: hypothetical protein ACI9DJ_001150 [Algoriphagus sp.]|jgi:hypothetical protein
MEYLLSVFSKWIFKCPKAFEILRWLFGFMVEHGIAVQRKILRRIYLKGDMHWLV